MRFLAHSDGKVLVPDEPVDLPKGPVVVTLEPAQSERRPGHRAPGWVQKAVELAARMPQDLPEDLAEQHDHYTHGTPKG